jgi:hypothetical protein
MCAISLYSNQFANGKGFIKLKTGLGPFSYIPQNFFLYHSLAKTALAPLPPPARGLLAISPWLTLVFFVHHAPAHLIFIFLTTSYKKPTPSPRHRDKLSPFQLISTEVHLN